MLRKWRNSGSVQSQIARAEGFRCELGAGDSGLVFMQRFGTKSWRSSGLMPFRWKPWHHRPKRLPPPVFGRGSLCYIHFGIRGSPFRTGFKITCQSLSKLLDLAQVDPAGLGRLCRLKRPSRLRISGSERPLLCGSMRNWSPLLKGNCPVARPSLDLRGASSAQPREVDSLLKPEASQKAVDLAQHFCCGRYCLQVPAVRPRIPAAPPNT